MPKTKISEWSSTPANNTDIDSINIAEGCAPSGINDAIRELMAQVKDLYAGTSGDLIAVAGGGCKTTCGISFLKNFVPDRCSLLFAHFASNIEIICCLEGAEERPFLHQSISDLHVTLQQKILGFLEHVVPTKLQDSVDFWGSFRAA